MSTLADSDLHPAIEFLKQRLPVHAFRYGTPVDLETCVLPFCGTTKGDQPVENVVEFARRCLSRSDQRHVLIVGNKGEGKTTCLQAIGAELQAEPPNWGESREVLAISLETLSSEDSRGFWETLRELTASPQAYCFCLDGLRQGIERPQGLNNWSLVRQLASLPNVSLIATISPEDLELFTAEQTMLDDLFNLITLREPERAVLSTIGRLHLEKLQQARQMQNQQDFVEETILACQTYLMNDNFPGKLTRVLKRCVENRKYQHQKTGVEPAILERHDLKQAIRELSGLEMGPQLLSAPQLPLKSLLAEEVFGQDEATASMAREIEMYLAGLSDRGKPASVVLLAGTTGVGKTELAKAVCRLYSKSKSLRTFTMGNYTEPHSVSAVIGVPPGYVGHEQGGAIVNQLLADPFSVFLLDEAEKAHANVWKPFLNLFDEGWIVDQRGRKASAENAIFILTTNAGERQIRQLFEQNQPYEVIVEKVKEAILKHRPERGTQSVFSEQLLARINEIIVFRPLSEEAIYQITATCLKDLKSRWQDRVKLSIDYSDSLIRLIASYCFQQDQLSKQREGGRLVRKTLRSFVEARVLEVYQKTTSVTETYSQLEITACEWSELTPETLRTVIQFQWIKKG